MCIRARRGIDLADVAEIVHGTTLVTNAVIERKGATLGLLTTRGFRDILEMGTEQRYDIYDLFVAFPEPLVRRDRRLEVDERVDALGRVVTPLNEASVERAVHRLVAEGCEAIAICFLYSYAHPAHAQQSVAVALCLYPHTAGSPSTELLGGVGHAHLRVHNLANCPLH